MADLAEITTGTQMDAPKVVDPTPVLALSNTAPVASATPVGSLGFLDKAKNLFGTASANVSSSAAKVASTANDNSGLMWIILAAMVAAGLFLFSAKGKKGGKGSFFKSSPARRASGGSLPR